MTINMILSGVGLIIGWEFGKHIFKSLFGKQKDKPLDIVGIEVVDVHIDRETGDYTIIYKVKTNNPAKKDVVKLSHGRIGDGTIS